MEVIVIIAAVIAIIFGIVVLFGAPYLPTLRSRVDDALSLLDLKPGQTMLELGSGDGRMLVAAAKKGIYAVGYEMNLLLVVYSYLRSWRYREFVTVKWANYWRAEWPESDGMYVFLLQKYMDKLDNKVAQYSKGKAYKLVSFNFIIKARKPTKSKKSMHLYCY